MTTIDRYEITGLKEVVEALKLLPVDIQVKVLKSFLNKIGRKFIVEPLKVKLNYDADTEKSITVMSNPGNKLGISAGVSGAGFHLRWADLGTKERKTKKGWNRGRINPKNQIQPHIEGSIEPILNYTEDELATEIDNILQRRLKRIRKK